MSVGIMLVKATVSLVMGAWAGRKIMMPLIQRIDASEFARRYPEFVFVLAMMVTFLYAMIAELIGLSAIVGAFVAGVALEGVNLNHSRHFKDGAEHLRIIFGAIFFVSLGVPARLMGMSTRDSLVIGFGMSPRGEVAIIVALLALNQGVIQQALRDAGDHEPGHDPDRSAGAAQLAISG